MFFFVLISPYWAARFANLAWDPSKNRTSNENAYRNASPNSLECPVETGGPPSLRCNFVWSVIVRLYSASVGGRNKLCVRNVYERLRVTAGLVFPGKRNQRHFLISALGEVRRYSLAAKKNPDGMIGSRDCWKLQATFVLIGSWNERKAM